MIFNAKKHNFDLYNTLLSLSRNIFFYKNIKLKDSFETRIYLMFFHFSIMMIVFKEKDKKFNQREYDVFFHNIENNIRELGFGDVAVNKKMKELNKILYDILIKLEMDEKTNNTFKINHKLLFKYFSSFKDPKSAKYIDFESYFINFFHFCFELPVENMIRELEYFKN